MKTAWPPNRLFIKRLTIYISAGACWVAAMWALSPWYQVAINATPSLPGILYIIRVGEQYERMKPVAVRPPENDIYREGIDFLKLVAATEGDVVETEGGRFVVNGTLLGIIHTESSAGKELRPGPSGVVGPGQIVIYAPHTHSFDSRYADIGWLNEDAVIGRAYRVF